MEIFNCRKFFIVRFDVPKSNANYSYVVSCSETGRCIIIDPPGSSEVLNYVTEEKMSVDSIVNTHSHPDHILGNRQTAKETGAEIISHPLGAEKTGARRTVDEGDSIPCGNLVLSVIYTPGHCPDHISLLIDGNAFVADTLFLAGCGNTHFGGNVGDLFKSVERLRNLDEKTRIFCGHNYAETNLEFALSIEPDNIDAGNKLNEVKNSANPVSTVGEEKLYNPFMRYDNPETAKYVRRVFPELSGNADIFAGLRELRNNW